MMLPYCTALFALFGTYVLSAYSGMGEKVGFGGVVFLVLSAGALVFVFFSLMDNISYCLSTIAQSQDAIARSLVQPIEEPACSISRNISEPA
jgi:hypothetical protein